MMSLPDLTPGSRTKVVLPMTMFSVPCAYSSPAGRILPPFVARASLARR